MTHKEIDGCRICGSSDLVEFLDLGHQALTGVFPATRKQPVTFAPLELVKCVEDREGSHCGLVQLKHSFDLTELFGPSYGYRSGLNPSMVGHLRSKVAEIMDLAPLAPGDIVIDIGSNDGTLLKAYPTDGLTLVGVDPIAERFKEHYPDRIEVIPEFFTSNGVRERIGGRGAKVVTSIAMFYDLEDPVEFMAQVRDVLADDGIWVFEQMYMPSVLAAGAYDVVCHEHLEYYRLKQIKRMVERVGLKILDVEVNAVNGGSFSVIAAKRESSWTANPGVSDEILQAEESRGLGTLKPYDEFRSRVYELKEELLSLIRRITSEGGTIFGYGASTKGNVLLQFCGLSESEIPFIAEVNEEKFGRFTPGTHIPIIPEFEARAARPDYLLILPWHFRDFFVEKEQEYLKGGGGLIFPLPNVEVVKG